MPTFTMRLTWPEAERPDDYVFRVDGRDVGRCYAMRAAGNRPVWRWTVYGSNAGGMALSLEEAQRCFKVSVGAAN